jgi:hypothetical protein
MYLGEEICGSPLTADSPGAIHQDLLVPEQVQVLVNVFWEVTELPDVGSQALTELALGSEGSENRSFITTTPTINLFFNSVIWDPFLFILSLPLPLGNITLAYLY